MHGSVLIKSEKNENELCGMTLYIGFTNEPAKLTLKNTKTPLAAIQVYNLENPCYVIFKQQKHVN